MTTIKRREPTSSVNGEDGQSPHLPEQAGVQRDEEDDPCDSVDEELMEQLIVRVPGLKGSERRDDVAKGMEAVAEPWLLQGKAESDDPDGGTSGERLRLIAGIGIDRVVGGEEAGENRGGKHSGTGKG